MDSFQLHNHLVVTQIQAKKTRKGWIGNKSKLIHLRQDIPCGFALCHEHHQAKSIFSHDALSQNCIYFIDSYTLINNTDILYNCQELSNLIILQSSIQKLKAYNPTSKTQSERKRTNLNINKYNAFKNFIESMQNVQDSELNQGRSIYVLPDRYHKGIQNYGSIQKMEIQQENQVLKQDDNQNQIKLFEKCILWYRQHCLDINLKNVNFHLLTSNPKIIAQRLNSRITIVPLISFLKQKNSNLLDFMGFSDHSLQKQANKSIQIFKSNLFQQHLSPQAYMSEVKKGKLFEGKYMEDKSYFKLGGQVHKLSLKNNRALFGDIVIIQLEDKSKWKAKFNKIQDQDDFYSSSNKFSLSQTDTSVNTNLIQFIKANPNLQPTGKVVSIQHRNAKNYCGSINHQQLLYKHQTNKIQQQSDQSSAQLSYEIYRFVPVNNRFPNFYIKTFNSGSLKRQRIMVSFDDWPSYSQFPLCHYVRTIGQQGTNKAQGDIILLQHNVQIKQFSKKAYDCLPISGDRFSIPEEELKYRLDLRTIDVVSIDPPGCKDIDDALHCIELNNGNLQIGVHIADVSFYVKPDTALDLQARNRCTTVYLVDRRTDMLPKLLTQNLCSLRSNVDRLAFSVIWEIDREANIISSKYCKSIIRSRRAFTYMQAQQLKDSSDTGSIAKSIRNLNQIAKKLKQKRNNAGALTLASTQVKIKLQQQTHSATDVQLYELVQTNHLIQEFMLLANIAVAQRIYERFPSISILRRHTQPKMNDLQTLKEIVKQYGFEFNFDSSKDLASSLDKIQRKNDPFFNKLIRIMTTRCMNQATYFCSADFDIQEFHHYGLAANFYTHFTSPIRRYADVLVHRLLSAAIDLQPLPSFMINKIKMTKVCQKMNMRNRMARYASRASSDYHTYQYFKEKKNSQKAIVTSIKEDCLVVMLIKYGLQSKIQFDEKQKERVKVLNKNKRFISQAETGNRKVKLFQYVDVQVKVQLHGFHKKMILTIQ